VGKNQKQPPVLVKDLASPPDRWHARSMLFERYSKQKPAPEAIPFLRRALSDSYQGTVKCAARSLGKLGPLAREAMPDLLKAAARVEDNDASRIPQAYSECVNAMAGIDPQDPELLPLIKHFVGLDNWGPISASFRALKAIGTAEAQGLLERTAAFWMPELNKIQRRAVEQLLADGISSQSEA